MDWTVQGSNLVGGEIFHVCPEQPCGSPSLQYSRYQVSFTGVKQMGCGVNHPPPSSIKVKEIVELYL
jgi:hypothetical protein